MSELLSYEEYLEQNGKLTYSNIGESMLPMFRQGKDLFKLTKKGPERCTIGDIVLCRRPPDRYLLRRIVDVRPDGYVILGDNDTEKETGIREEDVLAVATAFTRNGKRHAVSERGFQAYTSFWLCTEPLRVASKKLFRKTKRLLGAEKK